MHGHSLYLLQITTQTFSRKNNQSDYNANWCRKHQIHDYVTWVPIKFKCGYTCINYKYQYPHLDSVNSIWCPILIVYKTRLTLRARILEILLTSFEFWRLLVVAVRTDRTTLLVLLSPCSVIGHELILVLLNLKRSLTCFIRSNSCKPWKMSSVEPSSTTPFAQGMHTIVWRPKDCPQRVRSHGKPASRSAPATQTGLEWKKAWLGRPPPFTKE